MVSQPWTNGPGQEFSLAQYCEARLLIRSGKLSEIEAPNCKPGRARGLTCAVLHLLKQAPRGPFSGCKMVAQHIVLRLARQTARKQLLRPALVQVLPSPVSH